MAYSWIAFHIASTYETFKPELPECLHMQAYANALGSKVDKVKDRHQAVTGAFMQRLLIGKYKGVTTQGRSQKS